MLGLGSPTHPLPNESYGAWTASYGWKKLYGIECLYGGPHFVHQLSHAWIDFRAIQDDFMRDRGLDYFENSRRATYVQRQYAIRNPKAFRGYNTDSSAASIRLSPSVRPAPAVGLPQATMDSIRGRWC